MKTIRYIFFASFIVIVFFTGALTYRYQFFTYEFFEYLSKIKNLEKTSPSQNQFKPYSNKKDLTIIRDEFFYNPNNFLSKKIIKDAGLYENYYVMSSGKGTNGIFKNGSLVYQLPIKSKSSTSTNQIIDEENALVIDLENSTVSLFNFIIQEEIWNTKVENVHHWATAGKNYVFVPTRKFGNFPKDIDTQIKKESNVADCKDSFVWLDYITVLDLKDGSIVKKIDLLEIISKDDFLKITFERCGDPFHLNSIEPINQNSFEYFQDVTENDFIFSAKYLNLVALVSFEKDEIQWSLKDKFEIQHSPLLIGKYLYVFDNMGGDIEYGRTRVLKVNVESKKIVSIFEGSEDFIFEAPNRGRLYFNQKFPNSLFVLCHGQRYFFEINRHNMKFIKMHTFDLDEGIYDFFYL